jgi:hypothetical protein
VATLRQIVNQSLILRSELDRLDALQADKRRLQAERNGIESQIAGMNISIDAQQLVVDGARDALIVLVNE